MTGGASEPMIRRDFLRMLSGGFAVVMATLALPLRAAGAQAERARERLGELRRRYPDRDFRERDGRIQRRIPCADEWYDFEESDHAV
jgi:hypothetical protein